MVDLPLGPASTNQRDRLVVDDQEQPRSQRRVALPPLQRQERAGQRGLQSILRVGVVAHNRAAVAIQLPVIAVVDRRERPLVSGPHQACEPLVAKQTKPDRQYGRGTSAGSDRRRTHGNSCISATHANAKS
jgi:hypothetical protein